MLVTPVPGARLESVEKMLAELGSKVGNIRSQTDPDRRWQDYLAWTDAATRQLRSLVREADIDRLVLTPRYGTLVHNAMSRPLLGLLDLELEQRADEFHQAFATLAAHARRLWDVHGQFVLADTTVFIDHPQKLEELDFRPLVGARSQGVHWFIPMVVIDELDSLKRSKDKHQRWRARHSLHVIDSALSGARLTGRIREADPIVNGELAHGAVTVEVVLDPPGHIRLTIPDDEIVDRALAIQCAYGRKIRFVTFDTGQSTRARHKGLEVEKIPQLPEGDEPK